MHKCINYISILLILKGELYCCNREEKRILSYTPETSTYSCGLILTNRTNGDCKSFLWKNL